MFSLRLSGVGELLGENLEDALHETAAGADYLIAGTVFSSASKPRAALLGCDGLAAIARSVDVPVLVRETGVVQDPKRPPLSISDPIGVLKGAALGPRCAGQSQPQRKEDADEKEYGRERCSPPEPPHPSAP